MNQEHPVRDRVRLLENVRRDQQRLPAPQPVDVFAELADLVRIQPSRRLVHDQHVRIVQQRLRQPYPLPVTPRQLPDRLLQNLLQHAEVDDRLRPLLQSARLNLPGLTEEREELEWSHVGVERAALGQVSQSLGGVDPLVPDIEPSNGGCTLARGKIPGQQPHQGRLAGAVRSEKGDDLSLRNGERDLLDRHEGAEILAQPFGLDHRLRCLLGAVHARAPSPSNLYKSQVSKNQPIARSRISNGPWPAIRPARGTRSDG